MKKILSLISVLLVLFLVACNKTDNTSSENVSIVIEETSSVEETVSGEATSEDTSSKTESAETYSEVTSKNETPSKTESSSKKENASSIGDKTTSNTTNNSNTMTFDENGVPILNPNLPYTYDEQWDVNEDGEYIGGYVITYHQGGYHWNNYGEVWTDEDLLEWFG